ncbi:hypothetical protein B0H21DRAFT_825196 [Amylocystis lapponica]|nr:hypothetical protein B0H21DRAFT_825196 [Amylocystis lapponica]
MTEYDYSPAAYERFLATQTRVSKWVSSQHSTTVDLQAYFPDLVRTSEPGAFARNSRTREPRRGKTLPSHLSRSSVDKQRPQPSRSQTLPAKHHRSTSTPPRSRDPPPPMPVGVPMSNLPQPPPGYNAVYRTYQPGPRGGEIYLPPPRPGETYVIVPPKGRQIRIVPEQRGADVLRSNSRGSSARSPTKKGPPLLKRLLDNLSPANTKASRSGSRSMSRRQSF